MDLQSCLNLINYHYQVEVWKRHKQYTETESHVKMLNEFVKALVNPDLSKFGIVLFGLYGNGKTTLLNAFDNAVRYLDKQHNAFAEDMATTHKRYDPQVLNAKELARLCVKNEDEYAKLMDCNILCIDDCGTEPKEIMNYGNPYAPVADILEYRYEKQLFTALTTNLRPDDFFSRYGGRIKDRIPDALVRIVAENESYRAKW